MANNAIIALTNPFEHIGFIHSGGGGRTDDLKISMSPADDVTIYSGSICCNNGSNEATLGVTKNKMPLWSLNNIGDFDVASTANGGGKGSVGYGTQGTTGMNQYGNMNFLVGGRCYEIFTTEYVAGSYAYDDFVVAATGEDIGKVTKLARASYTGAQHLLGQVSRGTVEMPDRKWQSLDDLLFIWTMHIPAVS